MAWQWLGSQLVVLKLVDDLNCALERRLERGHDTHLQRRFRLDQQAVAIVLDIGDNTLRSHRERIAVIVRCLVIGRPIASLQIEYEATLLFFPTARPSEIDTPERCGMTI